MVGALCAPQQTTSQAARGCEHSVAGSADVNLRGEGGEAHQSRPCLASARGNCSGTGISKACGTRAEALALGAWAQRNQINLMFEVRRVRQQDVLFVLMKDKRQ
jgi:hypothetical protein